MVDPLPWRSIQLYLALYFNFTWRYTISAQMLYGGEKYQYTNVNVQPIGADKLSSFQYSNLSKSFQ